MADPNSPTCGEWLQFTSQYPGSGPCYPVLVQTVDHLNRCVSNTNYALDIKSSYDISYDISYGVVCTGDWRQLWCVSYGMAAIRH